MTKYGANALVTKEASPIIAVDILDAVTLFRPKQGGTIWWTYTKTRSLYVGKLKFKEKWHNSSEQRKVRSLWCMFTVKITWGVFCLSTCVVDGEVGGLLDWPISISQRCKTESIRYQCLKRMMPSFKPMWSHSYYKKNQFFMWKNGFHLFYAWFTLQF